MLQNYLLVVEIVLCLQVWSSDGQSSPCDSQLCENGALCEATDTGFTCYCVDGFAGETCAVNFDDCTSTPCRNNGECIDGVASYTCLCVPGFTDAECQTNIDDCHSEACLNNGTCVDLVGGYVCQCPSPFRGNNCSILPCDSLVCENGGLCLNDVNFNSSVTGYVCECPTGFGGARCENNLEDCDVTDQTSCSGNGLCVDGVNDYSCFCQPGWVGKYCQLPVDDCIENSCKNNATCSDLHLGYQCACADGYEGWLCERERDECSAWQPCENKATCVDMFNDYRCDCSADWVGKNCTEEVDECVTNPCQNGAQCLDVFGGFFCRCPPFYTGSYCETLYNPCAPEYNPCENEAKCITPPDGQYRCFCSKGFSGVNCEVNINECLSFPCVNNGTCEDITSGYICHCTPGWEGDDCEANIDECNSRPCQNGAECIDLLNNFECNCSRGYQGRLCQDLVDFCLQEPCFNGATCVSRLGNFQCLCPYPYTGVHCLELIDSCQSGPCEQNGTCLNTHQGYICNCPLSYTGETCNDRVDFCESEPCFNGATCTSLKNDYVCVCPEFLTGKQCTDLADYCEEEPCLNSGFCINGQYNYRCICAYGFTGDTCSDMIDFCIERPCQNSANCSNVPGGFTCECPQYFTGELCQSVLPTVMTTGLVHSSIHSIVSIGSSMYLPTTVISSPQVVSPSIMSVSGIMSSDNFIQPSTTSILDTSTTPVESPSLPRSIPSTPLFASTLSPYLDFSPHSTFQDSSTHFSRISITSDTLSNSHTILPTNVVSLSNSLSAESINVPSLIQSSFQSSLVTHDLVSTPTLPPSDTIISTLEISSKQFSEPTTSSTPVISISSTISSDQLNEHYSSLSKVIKTHTHSGHVTSANKGTSTLIKHTNIESSLDYSVNTLIPFVSEHTSQEIMSTVHYSSEYTSPLSTSSTPSDKQTRSFSSTSEQESTRQESLLKSSVLSMTSNLPSLYFSTPKMTLQTTITSIRTSITDLPSVLRTTAGHMESQSENVATSNTVTSESVHSSSTKSDWLTIPTTYTSTIDTEVSMSGFMTVSQISPTSVLPSFTQTQVSVLPSDIHLSSSNDDMTTNSDFLNQSKTSTVNLRLTSHSTYGNSEIVRTLSTSMSTHLSSGMLSSTRALSTPETSSDKQITTIISSTTISSVQQTIVQTIELSPWFSTDVSDLMSSFVPSQTTDRSATPDISSIVTSIRITDSVESVSYISTYFSSATSIVKSNPVSTLSSHGNSGTSVREVSTPFSVSSSFVDSFSSPFKQSVTSVYSSTLSLLDDTSFTRRLTTRIKPTNFDTDSLVFDTDSKLSLSPTDITQTNTLTLSTSFLLTSRSLPWSSSTGESSVSVSVSIPSPASLPSISEVKSTTKALISSTLPTRFSSTVNSIHSMTLPSSKQSMIFPSLSSVHTDRVSTSHSSTTSSKSSNTSVSSYAGYSISSIKTNSSITIIITSSILSASTKSFRVHTSSYFNPSFSTPTSISLNTYLSSIAPVTISTETSLSTYPPVYSTTVISPTTIVPTLSVLATPTPVYSTVVTSSYTTIMPTSSVLSISTPVYSTAVTSSTTIVPTSSVVSTSTPVYSIAVTSSSTTIVLTTPTPVYSTAVTSSAVSTSTPVYSIAVTSSSTTIVLTTPTPVYSTAVTSSATTIVPTATPGPSCAVIECFNGGVCREDGFGVYCDCDTGYIGSSCETVSSVCTYYTCENGGTCSITLGRFNVQIPKCDCHLPYSGARCEIEKLIYFPNFSGTSFIRLAQIQISSDQSNEIFLSIKTNQRTGTILYSSNQSVGLTSADTQNPSFIRLYMTDGQLQYEFSCDGIIVGNIASDIRINTGDIYDVVVRQTWGDRAGEWCYAAVVINEKSFVSKPVLTVKQPGKLGDVFVGGFPRYIYNSGKATVHILDGFSGCIRSLQVQRREIDLINEATESINIDNCNVPVCQHSPCKNGAICHSSGEEWYCNCPYGFGGTLCERKLCGVNACHHGGTCVILDDVSDQLCVCPYGTAGALCEKEATVDIPHFYGDQFGYSSYIAYEHPHYMEENFEIEMQFFIDNTSPLASRLLIFMGNTGSFIGRQDFIAVGIEFGHVVFRFDLGSGYAQIYSPDVLDGTIRHHAIKLGRDANTGWLKVDNQRNITGRSMGDLTALNTNTRLYVGGADSSAIGLIPAGALFEDGFKGCILNLQIKTHHTEFVLPGNPPGHVDEGRNVVSCSSMSCDHNPCMNDAECVEIGASVFCNCTGDWKGVFCMDAITVCDSAHACRDGSTCVPTVPEGYTCHCPLGKYGRYCEDDITISDPLFNGDTSYMSFKPVFIKPDTHIKLQIKIYQPTGIVFYVVQHHHTLAGDFLAITLDNGVPELRFHLGDQLYVLPSDVELETDLWYTIEAGRNATHGHIAVDGHVYVAMVTGMMSYLDVTSDIYIGGFPNMEDVSHAAFVREPVSFAGCIREMVVNGHTYELTEHGASAGRDILDCDNTSCGYSVCKHNGLCHVSNDTLFQCECTMDYFGNTCEWPIQCKGNTCLHGDCLRLPGKEYTCHCNIGWTGRFCDQDVVLGTSVHLNKDSYLVLSEKDFDFSNTSNTKMSFDFNTMATNCLFIWIGQTYADDLDYFGIGIENGRLKLVWNLGWFSKGEIVTSFKYNDGQWHSVDANRVDQGLRITIDETGYENRVSGDFHHLDTDGVIFIGGFEKGKVHENTFRYFQEAFVGCMRNLKINHSNEVEFDKAEKGRNVQKCS